MLLLLLASCQATQPDHCRMARATELPLQFGDGSIYMTAILNGTPATMILDTGSEETVITNEAANRLGLSLTAAGFSRGIGGSRGRYSFEARTFQIGTLHGRRFNLSATDMHISERNARIDGLLGVDFLAAYDIDLDLGEHRAILFGKVEGCSSAAAYLQQPLYGVPMIDLADQGDHRAMVRVDVDGHALTAVVDSGSDHTTIFRNAAQRLGLRLSDLAHDPHYHVGGIGPDSPEAVRHVLAPLTIGNLTITHMPVEILDQRSFDDADMLLGLDFLTRVHVWYSFTSRTLVMQYPPQPSPP